MKKIMIVDDEKDIRYSLKRILESEGKDYGIIEAEDGQKAIEILEKEKPNLILLDVMMPNMDGWETCKKIKENDATKNIPVIFLTAKPFSVDDLQKATKLKASEYLTKPFVKEQLIKMIENSLKS